MRKTFLDGKTDKRLIQLFKKTHIQGKRIREKIYKFSKVNALRERDVSFLFWCQEEMFLFVFALPRAFGLFLVIPPIKNTGVDDEHKDHLSVLTWEDAPRLITHTGSRCRRAGSLPC